jgi:hypothetical protein
MRYSNEALIADLGQAMEAGAGRKRRAHAAQVAFHHHEVERAMRFVVGALGARTQPPSSRIRARMQPP